MRVLVYDLMRKRWKEGREEKKEGGREVLYDNVSLTTSHLRYFIGKNQGFIQGRGRNLRPSNFHIMLHHTPSVKNLSLCLALCTHHTLLIGHASLVSASAGSLAAQP